VPLDPRARRLLDALSLGQARPAGVAARRQAFRSLMRLADTGVQIAATEDRVLPGSLPIRLYTPPPQAVPGRLPGLVFLHGGGFVCGDLDTHDALCRTLCADTGCRVIAVDYRLAPEHPYPAAVQDAHAATLWVIEHAAALGLDPARIAIAGESAGATLAAVVCQRVAKTHPGALALQLLLCPILDWAAGPASRWDAAESSLLNSEMIAQDLACYLPVGQDASDPQVSPLRAPSLGDQPPTHIHTAECDPLRDEGTAYADKLQLAGVEVRHTCHDGMVHLFYGLGRAIPAARAALGQIGAEIGAALA
jgi:acetyl esterase